MKTELLNPMLVLGAGAAALLLTGCASSHQEFGRAGQPLSTVAFVPVTDPREMVKWTSDIRIASNLRSVDTYYFTVPATQYAPRAEEDLAPGESAQGTGAPGGYQSATSSSQVILYRPGDTR
jgi:hypothetical protein